MTTTATPEPGKKINRIGLEMQPYRGGKTTLCAGCGHNAISERIIDAFFEMGIDPKGVIKLSGIGCSSKSPAYFLGAAHGFNTVHGRMPSVGTGAVLANRKLLAIGVSGDGDTGAIGIGQFVHLMRRNVPIIYIIEDNGCYGLTKGQFSPTADIGSTTKGGTPNELQPIDTCSLAIDLGASFVARSFSGDKKQLLSILKAALSHRGTCMIDVLSPCVTFNDHVGSTKSYAYVKEHEEPLGEINFVPYFDDITIDYEPGTTTEVKLHDGSRLYLKKVSEDYNPTDKHAALRLLQETDKRGEFATGILYVAPGQAGSGRAAQHRRRAAGDAAARAGPARRGRRSTSSWTRTGSATDRTRPAQPAPRSRRDSRRCDPARCQSGRSAGPPCRRPARSDSPGWACPRLVSFDRAEVLVLVVVGRRLFLCHLSASRGCPRTAYNLTLWNEH